MEPFPPKEKTSALEQASTKAFHIGKEAAHELASTASKATAIIGDVLQTATKGPAAAFGFGSNEFYQGEGNRDEDQGPIVVPQFWHRTEEENETIATSEVKIGQGSTFEAPSTPPFRTFEGYDGYLDWSDPKDVERAHQILAAGQPKLPQSQEELDQMRAMEEKHRGYSAGIAAKAAMIHLGMKDSLEQTLKCIREEKARDMVVHVEVPYNGEAPKKKLMASVFTPNQYHYVRSHGNIPIIEEEAWELEVSGLVQNQAKFNLAELKEMFEVKEYTVTLQCAGNRRTGLEKWVSVPKGLPPPDHPPQWLTVEAFVARSHRTGVLTGDEIMNTDWDEQGISTARYKAIRVKDILAKCGLQPECDEIEFIACDTVIKKNKPFNFAASVTLRKVLSGEVVLAFEMNGKPLPHIHGFPARILVMGYQGARSPKWVKKIVARIGPSMAPTQRKEYIWFPYDVGKHNVDYTRGMEITEWPVNSCIMSPLDNDVKIHQGWIEVMGWAWAGGGRWVERVELSTDDGHTWTAVADHEMSPKKLFAWRLWKTKIPCPKEGWVILCVRAFDNSANSQPQYERDIWNWKGYLNNAYHKIKIYSANLAYAQTAKRIAQMKIHGDSLEPLKKTLAFDPELEDPADKFVEGRKSPLPTEL